jgi:hypothetical protein
LLLALELLVTDLRSALGEAHLLAGSVGLPEYGHDESLGVAHAGVSGVVPWLAPTAGGIA